MAQASGNVVADPVVALPVAADSDMDQLPDWWEIVNGILVIGNNYKADDDNAGSPAGEEFIAGTDPQRSESYFHVAGESAGAVYKVYIPSVLNRVYSLEISDDLLGEWAMLTNGVPGSGNWIELMDDIGSSNRFYRVNVELE